MDACFAERTGFITLGRLLFPAVKKQGGYSGPDNLFALVNQNTTFYWNKNSFALLGIAGESFLNSFWLGALGQRRKWKFELNFCVCFTPSEIAWQQEEPVFYPEGITGMITHGILS